MRSSRFLGVALTAAVAFAMSMPSTSHADAPSGSAGNAAAAQELFNQGRALMGEERYTAAYPKLAESQRLDPGMGTEFNLADCEEHIGKTASAWAHYMDVADGAKIAGQTARERVARQRATALETHLARLSVKLPASVQIAGDGAIEVRRDGVVIGAAQLGVGLPVDPGEHQVTASAPGKKPFTRTVKAPSDTTTVVDIPKLDDLPQPVAAAPAPAPLAGPTEEEKDREHRAHVQRVAGISVAALGVVGVGLGTAFGIISKGKHDDADPHCGGGSTCDATGVSLRNDAIHAGNASTIAFAVGAAALIGGGVLFFTAPHSSESSDHQSATKSSASARAPATATATPWVGPGSGGVAFAGSF